MPEAYIIDAIKQKRTKLHRLRYQEDITIKRLKALQQDIKALQSEIFMLSELPKKIHKNMEELT